MNFFAFHIGDYLAHTGHLTPIEDIIYRRMLDLYYLRETPLPCDTLEIAKLIRMRDHVVECESVLKEFFKKSDIGWSHGRCDFEISEAQCKRMKAKESAAQRWDSGRNANAMRTHTKGNATNPNPITNPNSKHTDEYPEEFIELWNAYPKRPGANKKSAFNAWLSRLKKGFSKEDILDGVIRYARYCEALNTEPQYIKQPATFLGPQDHFLSDWTVTKSSGGVNGKTRESVVAAFTGNTGRGESAVFDGSSYRVD